MLTHHRLLEVLDYSVDTGLFHWKVARGTKIKPGDLAGNIRQDGYARIIIDSKSYPSHRLAWFYFYGKFPDNVLDHINTVRADNRISNLREDTGRWNNQNRRSPCKNNKLGVMGVTKEGKKFKAQITIKGRTKRLGSYATLEEASAAYLEAKRKYHEGNTL